MTKKSHKLLTRWRKENVGCMWGLISIFDFRRGRSIQRLLSDKKCGSSRNLGIRCTRNKVGLPCNMNESHGDVGSKTHISDTEAESNLGLFDTPRKKELSRAHHSRRDFDSKLEWIKAEFGIGANPEKNNKEAIKNGAVCFENNLISSPSSISQQSDYPSMSTIHSSELKLGEFMLHFCNSGLYCKRKQSEFENNTDNVSVTILQKAIVDLTEAFLRENSNNLSENIEVHQPKGMVDVLEMLNLNKELFFKLLQDPNSPIRKHIQELQNVQLSSKSFTNHNKLLGESKKRPKQNEGDDVKGPNKIVVLKPTKMRNQKLSNTVAPTASIRSLCNIGNEEGGERSSSHFSLKEFRKRFRNIIGTSKTEKHRIAMDGIMHNIPYGEQISRKNETFCRRDKTENGGQRRSGTKGINKKSEFSIASETAGREKLSKNAAFCDEAKRHLAEFLWIGSENESSPPLQVSKSLGRILSFPGFDYLSPRHNLVREKEAESLQEQTSSLLYHSRQRNSAENLDLLRNMESFPRTDKIQEDEREIMEIVGTKDNECIQIEDDLLGGIIKEEPPMLLEPEQQEAIFEKSTPSTPIPLSSATLQEPNDTDCAAEKAGRPSPISVLEPNTFEDIKAPTSLIREHEEAAIVETQTELKGCQIGNSAAASGEADSVEDGLKCTEFYEALLFDELEVSYGLFFDDPKLLFDSIDEVLTEMKEWHFGCSPWVSFMKSTIWSTPELKYFRKKASRRLNWNLDLQFPSTLKQAVEKDLEGRVWFDFQFEADGAVGEIADVIFEYLVEETALELWD